MKQNNSLRYNSIYRAINGGEFKEDQDKVIEIDTYLKSKIDVSKLNIIHF